MRAILSIFSVASLLSAQSSYEGGPSGLIDITEPHCGEQGFENSCAEGYCCSKWGFCGNTDEYCGIGCQPLFGNCNTLPTTSVTVTTYPTTTSVTVTSYSTTTSVTVTSYPTATAEPEGTNVQTQPPNQGNDQNNDFSGMQNGEMSWYEFNGGVAFCNGQTYQESDLVVAMNDESRKCGQKMLIRAGNGNSVVVTVQDKCPSCHQSKIDATRGVWAALGVSTTIGIFKDFQWKYI